MTERVITLAGLALALLIAFGAIAEYQNWAQQQRALLDALRETGLTDDLDRLALHELQKEEDPQRARERAARVLLAPDLEEISHRVAGQQKPPGHDPLRAERFALVRRWASETLATRPSSWEAAMMLGEVRFLEKWLAGDALRERDRWEAPLQLAHRLSPEQPEPLRLLAGSYIRVWPELSESEREDPLTVIQQAFLDLESFEALLDEWLAADPSLGNILRVMPGHLAAWRTLDARFRKAEDHVRIAETLLRSEAVRLRTLEDALENATQLLRFGSPGRERQLNQSFELMRLEYPTLPNRATAPLLERALQMHAPGPLPPHFGPHLRGWLDWAVDRCLLAACPITPDAFRRLTQAVADLEAPRAAAALLAAGDFRRAERQRVRDPFENPAEWTPFFLLKAEHLSQLGRHAEALEALRAVDSSWHRRASYWRIRSDVLQQVSGSETAAPDAGVRNPSAIAWGADDWFRQGQRRARLELVPAREGSGISIEVERVPGGGATLAILFDAAIVGVYPVLAPQEIRIDTPVRGPIHLVEVELVSGGWPQLGAVRLHESP